MTRRTAQGHLAVCTAPPPCPAGPVAQSEARALTPGTGLEGLQRLANPHSASPRAPDALNSQALGQHPRARSDGSRPQGPCPLVRLGVPCRESRQPPLPPQPQRHTQDGGRGDNIDQPPASKRPIPGPHLPCALRLKEVMPPPPLLRLGAPPAHPLAARPRASHRACLAPPPITGPSLASPRPPCAHAGNSA